jgi:TetR/AcrR family transcriptional regulator, transcriptional repressor for nem operon
MRYAASHKQETRERILDKAGALAKAKGFGTTGVDALMAAAGLTAGGFYAHFRSKSELLSALIDRELGRSRAMFEVDSQAALIRAVQAYLSLGHVEHPQRGCPLTSLSSEIARADDAVRKTFEDRLLEIQRIVRARTRDDAEAWSLIAQAVGAVTLARAMHSRTARKSLLDGVARSLLEVLEREPRVR